VKPEEEVASMMPVEPPSAGPDRAPPPDPVWVGVGAGDEADIVAAEGDDEDGEIVAAAATPEPASAAIAHVRPAPRIHPLLFPGRNRRPRGQRACPAADTGADPVGEWRVGSWSSITELLSFTYNPEHADRSL
jgi:hypothetical protein